MADELDKSLGHVPHLQLAWRASNDAMQLIKQLGFLTGPQIEEETPVVLPELLALCYGWPQDAIEATQLILRQSIPELTVARDTPIVVKGAPFSCVVEGILSLFISAVGVFDNSWEPADGVRPCLEVLLAKFPNGLPEPYSPFEGHQGNPSRNLYQVLRCILPGGIPGSSGMSAVEALSWQIVGGTGIAPRVPEDLPAYLGTWMPVYECLADCEEFLAAARSFDEERIWRWIREEVLLDEQDRRLLDVELYREFARTASSYRQIQGGSPSLDWLKPQIRDNEGSKVIVDVDRRRVTFCGETYDDIDSEQALRWLKVLTDRPGEWISSTDLERHDSELYGARTSRLKNAIPEAVACHIESTSGKGSRWNPPA